MNLNIPQYDFYKHKYGDELLIDVVPLNTIKKYLKEQPVHILTYYDITLITSGEGEFLIDHQANRVKPQDIIFTRPGEIRKWDDKTIQDGFALIFEEEFLLSFFNDPAFLRNLSYFHTERRSSKLSLDKKAYGRISELISEIDKEIKDYQSKDKHLLRALLYETLMLLNRLYASSNALPPDTNARSKSIYVDPLEKVEGDIEFKDVTFRYGNRAPALDHISFTIPAGKKVALVGSSGSGKSTITKLLLKYYDPEEGEIDFNGVNLAEYTHDSVRRAIAYVPQNIELFSKTIYDNIRISRMDATMEEVKEAAKKADAHEFIRHLPLQYNTYLEEAGNGLSGGEKQRIALARAEE